MQTHSVISNKLGLINIKIISSIPPIYFVGIFNNDDELIEYMRFSYNPTKEDIIETFNL